MSAKLVPSPGDRLRDAALSLLDGGGPIMETARLASDLLGEADLPAVVVGGVSVILNGHLRTTRDVDIFVPGDLRPVADALIAAGFAHDPIRREFVRELIPVHLVAPRSGRRRRGPIRRGRRHPHRHAGRPHRHEAPQRDHQPAPGPDLADVIGLARHHRLTGEFAARLDKSLRPAFRKIARALRDERPPIG